MDIHNVNSTKQPLTTDEYISSVKLETLTKEDILAHIEKIFKRIALINIHQTGENPERLQTFRQKLVDRLVLAPVKLADIQVENVEKLSYATLAKYFGVTFNDKLIQRFDIIFQGKNISSMQEHEMWKCLFSKLTTVKILDCLEGRNAEICKLIQNKVQQYDCNRAYEVSKTKKLIKDKFDEEFEKISAIETDRLQLQLNRLNAISSRVEQSATKLAYEARLVEQAHNEVLALKEDSKTLQALLGGLDVK